LSSIKATTILPVIEFHPDNGSEFINNYTEKWCKQEGIAFTRSRDYRKNDNCLRHECRVEQKNGAVVREYVGYDRLEGLQEQALLVDIYRYLVPLLNYFTPVQKLQSKARVGPKEISNQRFAVHDKPQSPFQRLIESPEVCQEIKDLLKAQITPYNPCELQHNVNKTILRLRQRQAQSNRIITKVQR
jgi:hypothetical protein